MPRGLSPWKKMYPWLRLWRKGGFLEGVHASLREKTRLKMGREAEPSAGSVKTKKEKTRSHLFINGGY